MNKRTSSAGIALAALIAGAAIAMVQEPASAPAGLPEAFTTIVQIDDRPYVIDLEKRSVRSPGFRAYVQRDDGSLCEFEPPPVSTYRGRVRGIAGSTVAASLIDGDLTATIRLPPDIRGRGGGDETAAGGGAGPQCNVTEIAFDADHEFYLLNDSDEALVVTDIEGVMNGVTAIYENDVDISYEITSITVRTSAAENPYTSNDCLTLLCQFRHEWNKNFPIGVFPRDTAHLMTGRNLGGCTSGLPGVAWIGVLCNESGFAGECGGAVQNLAYGLSQSKFTANFNARVALTAHQLGHNWNACHCDEGDCFSLPCEIMCSGGPGCPFAPTQFGPGAIAQIEAFRDSRTCLECEVLCDADLDGDGTVGITDFLMLLAAWGACPDPCPPLCLGDLDGDCNVGITDFLALLANWGPCP